MIAVPSLRALSAAVGALEAPLLAACLSLAMVMIGRARGVRWVIDAAAGAGALAGWWVALAGFHRWRALLEPIGTAQHLLLVAVATMSAGAAAPQGRGRWLVAAGAAFVGWWMARSPASGEQFWRVWLAGSLLVAVLAQVKSVELLSAIPLALAAGLFAVGAPAVWVGVALVAAASVLPVLAAPASAPLPASMLAVAVTVATTLGAGRIVRGRLTTVDLACLIALLAPALVPPLRSRLGRAATLAPVLAAAVASGLAYAGKLVLLHR